jgi:hypothetical protein
MCRNLTLREEARKSWDYFKSDEIIYFAESVESHLEIRNSVCCIDWISKYNVGDIYLELKVVLFGERNSYFNYVIEVAPECLTNSIHLNGKLYAAKCHDLMLIDIAKFVQLPEGMISKSCPGFVRLKRLDNGDNFRREVRDFFPVTLIGGERTFGIDREAGLPSRFISGQQCELPCQMVKSRANGVGKLANQERKGVGCNSLFDPHDVCSLFRIVLFRDGAGIFSIASDFAFEFVEMFIRPTQFHLCVNNPYTQRHKYSQSEHKATA